MLPEIHTVNPHKPGSCQLCDMYADVSLWGPPVGRVPWHQVIAWPIASDPEAAQ